jgi:hypothetical protein
MAVGIRFVDHATPSTRKSLHYFAGAAVVGRYSSQTKQTPWLLFLQVAPHLSLQGLSGPRSRPTATLKIW